MAIARRPAWREPMLWLVLAFPLAAVAGGFVLVSLASRDRSDAVAEPVRRVAQVQVADFTPDLEAAATGLHGRLDVERRTGAVAVRLDRASRGPLVLTLAHASDERRDVRLVLERAPDGRHLGRAGALGAAPYTAMLETAGGDARIAGRLAAGAASAELLPRLQR